MEIKTIQLTIKGMTCDHCAASVTKQLDADGILDKNVSYKEADAMVTFDENKISGAEIEQLINATGHYQVTGLSELKNDSVNEKHLIIVGGGSAAFAAAIQGGELGAKVTMINDGLPIGGTCVNVGCVPSKNLIRAAQVLHKSGQNPFHGIKTEGRLTDFKKLIEQKQELVLDLRQQKYIDVVKDKPGFRLIKGRAKVASSTAVEVNGETINGSHLLIASGARPNIPDIPGLADVPYLTNESAFELEELPESLIILGGRYVALEIAQMFARLGSKVTVLQRSGRILPTEAPDLTEALSGYLKEEGIEILTGNEVQMVSEHNGKILVETLVHGKRRQFKAEKIIAAAGRSANTNNMGLKENGVELTQSGFIHVNEHLPTSVPTIYAAGDVLGKRMFVYTAAYEGKLAAANMFGTNKSKRNYSVVPWVVFTDPQAAGVGLDEVQAAKKNIDAETALLPLAYVPRSLAAKDTRGFIKLIRDKKTDRLVGARILAPEGSELLMEAALAIKFGITVSQLKEMFHPYLTLSEGIKLAAITFDKDVKELSCCAT